MKIEFNKIDNKNFNLLRFLNSPNLNYEIHQKIEHLQENESTKKRILWRLEGKNSKSPYLIVQTNFQPNLERFRNQFNFSHYFKDEIHLKTINLNPNEGEMFFFKIRANPTKNVTFLKDKKKKGHRIPITKTKDDENDVDEIAHWLERKGKLHGFSPLNLNYFKETILELEVVKNKKHTSIHNSILFSGLLQVKDSNLFKSTIENGIGNAKILGFGLLSIKRMH
ncbi:type I-E CRISPR-associated protein Cas6/Cse3/CasE [Silvanigrella aquatica]|uniref:Type I-E CRISPR-associated protein Cas6/Cse3/CasE n=2 Tax=Silvanigrella aquatica TaxID=1915309 RepID=A0A1L4CXY3_9BACT|nr:type I-E CRISPR-associated protein Cas6/Cse3/CasE [Silvanigrella aquatica]